jgi:hypothetical protein
MARDRLFNMRMSAAETARLDTLAAHFGISAAETIRMIVKLKYDEITAEKRKTTERDRDV